jgi:hypothetical protein
MKKLTIRTVMDNGDEFDTTTKTADYILFEKTAKTHRWGGLSENPALWEAFLAWASLKRTGQYTLTWEKFLDEVDIVEATQVTVDPTTEEVGDASSPS